jgi:hypothetical protein
LDNAAGVRYRKRRERSTRKRGQRKSARGTLVVGPEFTGVASILRNHRQLGEPKQMRPTSAIQTPKPRIGTAAPGERRIAEGKLMAHAARSVELGVRLLVTPTFDQRTLRRQIPATDPCLANGFQIANDSANPLLLSREDGLKYAVFSAQFHQLAVDTSDVSHLVYESFLKFDSLGRCTSQALHHAYVPLFQFAGSQFPGVTLALEPRTPRTKQGDDAQAKQCRWYQPGAKREDQSPFAHIYAL